MNELYGFENVISLMNLYRDEWKHRDNCFFSVLWRFVYISLIITFMPFLFEGIGIDGALFEKYPVWFFSIAGIAFAGFGMYLSIAESKRIEAIDLAYKQVMKKLPNEYQMIMLKDETRVRNGRMYMPRMNYVLCVGVYSVIIVLAIINLLV